MRTEQEESVWGHRMAAARCMKSGDYNRAFDHYDKAMAFNPLDSNLERDQEICRLLRGDYIRKDLMDPPDKNGEISLAQLIAMSDAQLPSEEEMTSKKDKTAGGLNLTKELGMVIKAYRHLYGWGVEKDPAVAATWFGKADCGATEAEAKYNLALLHLHGLGIPKNEDVGIELLQEVAQMPVQGKLGEKNYGVAESQYALGVLHEYGGYTNVRQSFQVAAMWYKKSYHSEFLYATCQLGVMYYKGAGVPKNESMAEMYWREAFKLKTYPACAYLLHLYIKQMEYVRAYWVIDVSLNAKDDRINIIIDKLKPQIKLVKKNRNKLEATVIDFEKQHKLIVQGFTFKDRLDRMRNSAKPLAKAQQLMRTLALDKLKISIKNGNDVHGLWYEVNENTLYDLCWNTACGSVYSSDLLETLILYSHLMKVLTQYENDSSPLDNIRKGKEFLNLVTGVMRLDGQSLKWELRHLDLIFKLLTRILDRGYVSKNPVFAKKLDIALGEFGLYLALKGKSFWPFSLGLIIRAWTLHPDHVRSGILYAEHFSRYGFIVKAYVVGAEALERFQDNVDLLYNHALVCLRNTNGVVDTPSAMRKTALSCFEKFLDLAPADHKKVPEAYYNIGVCYLHHYQESGKPPILYLSIIEHYYELGKLSELRQSLCFTPYDSVAKHVLESVLQPSKSNQDRLDDANLRMLADAICTSTVT